MAEKNKFFICVHCGNIAGLINNSGVPMFCCGEEMQELVPNTVDASLEKHLPSVTVEKDKVTIEVGSVPHPMIAEHYIQWVYLQTAKGGQRKELKPNTEPKATFILEDDEPIAAFAYCNIHGLWKTIL